MVGLFKFVEEVFCKDDIFFFVFNLDVMCDYFFKEFVVFYKLYGDEGIIVVIKVEEFFKYGVVVYKLGYLIKIDCFVEKLVEFVGNRINVGMYIFNMLVFDCIELRFILIE